MGPLLNTSTGTAHEEFVDALVIESTCDEGMVVQGVYWKTDILADGSLMFRQDCSVYK